MANISRLLPALVVIGVLCVAGGRRADACGGGGSSNSDLVVAAVVVGGGYASLTLGFAIGDLAASDHSMGYGVAEAVIHTPIALVYGSALVGELRSQDTSSDAAGMIGLMTVLHGALAAHGIYTIVQRSRGGSDAPRRHLGPPGSFQVRGVTAALGPAPIPAGAGFGLSGTF